jgi:trans-2,3-dihydro-3-hydroxyanthranilate isomerase
VPFAGHPTIGTAHVLVATGAVPAASDTMTVVLEEGVGPVPVTVRLAGGVPVHGQLTTAQAPEERTEVDDLAALASTLSLDPAEFLGGAHAPTGVSCGLPFLLVPLRSTAAVTRARLDPGAWQRVLRDRWAAWPMVFAMAHDDDPGELPAHVRGTDIRARVFVPGSTVPEDPATGSANAALAAYLAARTPRTGTLRWSVAQGVEMGRPSRLELEAERTDAGVGAVRVGGASVIMAEGTLRL